MLTFRIPFAIASVWLALACPFSAIAEKAKPAAELSCAEETLGPEQIRVTAVRAPLMKASLWGNRHLPQIDFGIILSMVAEFIKNPILHDDLTNWATLPEADKHLEAANDAHKAYNLNNPFAHMSAGELHRRFGLLVDTELSKTKNILSSLMWKVTEDQDKWPEFDDFYKHQKHPLQYTKIRRLSALLDDYLKSKEFVEEAKLHREALHKLVPKLNSGKGHKELETFKTQRDKLFKDHFYGYTRKHAPHLLELAEAIIEE